MKNGAKQYYVALMVARHSETLEPMVVYSCLYKGEKGAIWARPLKMWEEDVIDELGQKVPRFKLIGPAVDPDS